MIKKEKGRYVVISETSGRVFGRYRTKKEARKRLQQMEIFKHLRGKRPREVIRRLTCFFAANFASLGKVIFDIITKGDSMKSMDSHSYEVEIKCLLNGEEAAYALREQMFRLDPDCQCLEVESQLNHYFLKGDLRFVFAKIKNHLQERDRAAFEHVAAQVHDYSLRTRKTDTMILLFLKASVDDTTSANGITRIEVEASLPSLTLEELDTALLDSGFRYQSKWSRKRENYRFLGMNATIDRNAGYGYMAEFEVVVPEESEAHQARARIRKAISLLGLQELSQVRLERMFAYYNAHWPDYYGTEKIFVVE
jgi:adenylate cyclase class IV